MNNRLTVVVLKARNLPKMDMSGLADPYVKIYFLYNSQRIGKRKTRVKTRTLSPVFNESFVFDIPNGANGLNNVSLEFMLIDWDRITKNEVRAWNITYDLSKLFFHLFYLDLQIWIFNVRTTDFIMYTYILYWQIYLYQQYSNFFLAYYSTSMWSSYI